MAMRGPISVTLVAAAILSAVASPVPKVPKIPNPFGATASKKPSNPATANAGKAPTKPRGFSAPFNLPKFPFGATASKKPSNAATANAGKAPAKPRGFSAPFNLPKFPQAFSKMQPPRGPPQKPQQQHQPRVPTGSRAKAAPAFPFPFKPPQVPFKPPPRASPPKPQQGRTLSDHPKFGQSAAKSQNRLQPSGKPAGAHQPASAARGFKASLLPKEVSSRIAAMQKQVSKATGRLPKHSSATIEAAKRRLDPRISGKKMAHPGKMPDMPGMPKLPKMPKMPKFPKMELPKLPNFMPFKGKVRARAEM